MRPWRASGPALADHPLLLASPHSGTHMPAAFLASARLSQDALRQFEDAHVHALLAPAVAAGVPLVEATHARAWLDLNRAETELDRTMFSGPLDLPVRLTDRVRAGYGVIPRMIAPDRPIYRGLLDPAEAHDRLARAHRPYHAALAARLDAVRTAHGAAVLVDCHSMPTLPAIAGPPAQIVIGDLFGRSAAGVLAEALAGLFAERGLAVGRNQPYAGGHTTRRHASPADGIHVLQVEIDRALYMDQPTLARSPGFDALAALLAEVFAAFAGAARSLLPLLRAGARPGLPLAAE
jgi:N-formylglutamate amidohydrolase